jgi:catechol 2,3-dioxygenase-like lactoylglutathione lyase family enzyme
VNDSGLIGIIHPVVITRDLPRALHYYVDLLGLKADAVTTHDPEKIAALGGPTRAAAQAVILHAPDGSELEIACFTSPEGDAESRAGWPDAGIRSITFRVADIERTAARLDTAGYRTVNEIVDFGVQDRQLRVAYVHAPDGVILTLLEESGR